MLMGIDALLNDHAALRELQAKRVGLLAHPASVSKTLEHSVDRLLAAKVNVTAAFGPQHGLRGDKQDNMVESDDFVDARYGIPVFSLYGQSRRLTPTMLEHFDVLLIDLQDLGCRIYTFLTTVRYMLEDCGAAGKSVWVLDRPNPAGRPVEGLALRPGQESFVGSGRLVMRHSLTLGEAALWFMRELNLSTDCRVIQMQGWQPHAGPEYGWPQSRSWVNPSPNAQTLSMARAYAGTVMLEGTTLSEGRGTTRALELMGAPDLPMEALLNDMQRLAPQWMQGVGIRPVYFEPTFHKHVHQLCSGMQWHLDGDFYQPNVFKPWRLMALFFKAIRRWRADYPLWRDFPYEYETNRLAIDVINGGSELRQWVDDSHATVADLEHGLHIDETAWRQEMRDFYLYA